MKKEKTKLTRTKIITKNDVPDLENRLDRLALLFLEKSSQTAEK